MLFSNKDKKGVKLSQNGQKGQQAGAELCQAQVKLGRAKSDLVIEVIFQL